MPFVVRVPGSIRLISGVSQRGVRLDRPFGEHHSAVLLHMPGSHEQLRVAIQVAKRPRLETEFGRPERIKHTDVGHAAPGVLSVLLQEAERGGINASW